MTHTTIPAGGTQEYLPDRFTGCGTPPKSSRQIGPSRTPTRSRTVRRWAPSLATSLKEQVLDGGGPTVFATTRCPGRLC